MGDRGRIERMWFAHPLWHEPLLTGIGHEPIVSYPVVVVLRTYSGPLSVQRVIRVVNDNVFTPMMGSMQVLRSAEPSTSFAIWAAIPTAWPLPTPA
jgi:hypothetical protein